MYLLNVVLSFIVLEHTNLQKMIIIIAIIIKATKLQWGFKQLLCCLNNTANYIQVLNKKKKNELNHGITITTLNTKTYSGNKMRLHVVKGTFQEQGFSNCFWRASPALHILYVSLTEHPAQIFYLSVLNKRDIRKHTIARIKDGKNKTNNL